MSPDTDRGLDDFGPAYSVLVLVRWSRISVETKQKGSRMLPVRRADTWQLASRTWNASKGGGLIFISWKLNSHGKLAMDRSARCQGNGKRLMHSRLLVGVVVFSSRTPWRMSRASEKPMLSRVTIQGVSLTGSPAPSESKLLAMQGEKKTLCS